MTDVGYVTVAQYREFAASIGTDLTGKTDAELEAQLVKGAMYIEAQEPRLIGTRTDPRQQWAYPRRDLVINGYTWGANEIPPLVEKAQMYLALEIGDGDGGGMFDAGGELPVIEERVGPMTVKYAAPKSDDVTFADRAGMALSLLEQLCKTAGGMAGIVSVPIVRT